MLIRFFILLMLSERIFASDSLEEKLRTGLEPKANHVFIYNPSLLSVNDKIYSFIAITDVKKTNVIASPNDTLQNIEYRTEDDILAAGFLKPFGGGSFGLSYTQYHKKLIADNDIISRKIEETRQDDIYSFRFVLNLTPTVDFGFQYYYMQSENNIFGSFFLSREDATSYKGFLSGYRIGLSYKTPKLIIGAYTSPAPRGKSLIEGENKIVAEYGTGGLDISYQAKDKILLGLGVTRWFYRKDDRMENSTSPIDQRRISLNGLDLDQYLAKIESWTLGLRHKYRPQLNFLFSLSRQESIFHFDDESLPGDNREDLSSFRYWQYQLGAIYIKSKLEVQLSYHQTNRSQAAIVDNSFRLGSREYIDYSTKDSGLMLKISFKP